jgi:hypothetical protein
MRGQSFADLSPSHHNDGAANASVAVAPLRALILQNQDNLTALGTIRAPNFVSNGRFRGTTSIVQSCVVTLVACIYTALHLNVPASSKLTYTFANKGIWVFVGLIAPEIVLCLAVSLFLEARRLAKELNALAASGAQPVDLESATQKPLTEHLNRPLAYGVFFLTE